MCIPCLRSLSFKGGRPGRGGGTQDDRGHIESSILSVLRNIISLCGMRLKSSRHATVTFVEDCFYELQIPGHLPHSLVSL